MYTQQTDGKNHINIYSKGWTELGRFLSNFARYSIATDDGPFVSIEGYWYWLGTKDDRLRALYGYQAKSLGKTLPKISKYPANIFQEKIRDACWKKIHSNKNMYDAFVKSTLPFTHYYVFNNTIIDGGTEWLLEMWSQYRTYIQNNYN